MFGSSLRHPSRGRRARLRPVGVIALVAAVSLSVSIPAAQADPSYLPTTPQLATITGTASNPAPWNEWQGDSAAGTAANATATISGNGATVINPLQVLPTYEPGESGGSLADDYPNVSITSAASNTDSDTSIPYSSGVVGTPGPLAGYCGTGDWASEGGLNWYAAQDGTPIPAPTVNGQPAGETLPLGPDYFPHIVLNRDGTLTGYFDYRPKDENEGVLVATSTDGGQDWTFDGIALQQDSGYCASADTNDDGQGHPNVLNFDPSSIDSSTGVPTGGTNELFTLQRAAGDNLGVGMLVHNLSGGTASDPVAELPSSQPVGTDPDAFVEPTDGSSTVQVPASGGTGVSITVNTTGYPGTVNELVAGGFVDLGNGATPNYGAATAANVITCTSVTPSSDPTEAAETSASLNSPAQNSYGTLNNCTADGSSPVTVNQGDLIEQVLGYVSAQTPASTPANTPGVATSAGSGATTFPITIPSGPNTETGDGGYAQIDVSPTVTAAAATSGSSNLGFTYETDGQQINLNAPNRLYVAGVAVYCDQSNNNPTTEIENCSTGPSTGSLSSNVGDPIIADPVTPENTQITTGLVAPDGIVGELQNGFPTAQGAAAPPAGATYVMYTEKELNYFVAGEVSKAGTFGTKGKTTAFTVQFFPWPYLSEDLASQITTSGSGDAETFGAASGQDINITLGDATTGDYDQVSCTGAASSATGANGTAFVYSASAQNTDFLTGCTITAATTAAGAAVSNVSSLYGDTLGKNSMLAAPGAALENPTQLQQTGEGKAASKATNAEKLYSNNEDLALLRVAWTLDGVNYYDSDLENDGVISGSDTSSVASTAGTLSGLGQGSGSSTIAAGGDGQCASDTSYTDLTNPYTACNPVLNGAVDLNEYAPANNGGAETADATEQRWPGSAGSIIYNAQTGRYELFLSGAWGGDGDSDAFDQIWESTSSDGLHWSVPQSVVSTDYTFAASAAQNASLAAGTDAALGITGYYSGRAYGPSVVPNPDGGGLLMVFAGYNIPKGSGSNATVLGTDASDPYVIGEGPTTPGGSTFAALPNLGQPMAYRNILVETLDENDGATINITAPTGAVYGGSGTLSASSGSDEPITLTADPSSSSVCSVSGDTVAYIGAGTCEIDASQPAGDGYADAGSGSVSFTVAQAPLTVYASSQSFQYGSGGLVPVTASYSGFVNGDNAQSLGTAPNCTTAATNSSDAGAYPATCSGAADPNYAISYVAGSVTITQAPLTITASNGSMTYGGSVPTITASYSGFVNGDTTVTTAPTCGTTATSSSPVGSYQSSCSGAVDSNYTISYQTGQVTVGQASLTVTASSPVISWDSPVPAITASYQGFVNGDNASSLTTQPACSTTATKASAPGIYPSSCSGAADPNYVISYVKGSVTVTKAASTTTLTLATRELPELLPLIFSVQVSGVTTPAGTVDVFDGSDLLEVLPLIHGQTIGIAWPLAPGVHSLTAVYEGDQDYQTSTSAAETVTVQRLL